jgi:uncharacterized protein
LTSKIFYFRSTTETGHGRRVLRAGWLVIILILTFTTLRIYCAVPLERLLDAHWDGKSILGPWKLLRRELVQLCVVFSTIGIVAWLDQRPIVDYGYVDSRGFRRLWCGIACGLAAISLLIGPLWACGLFQVKPSQLPLASILYYGAAWAIAFFIVGLLEESKFRGCVQFTLARGIGFWAAAIVLSVTFALLHLGNAGETLMGLIEVALHGILYATAVWYTKSLWWSIGFHAAWDWSQSFLYGTPDSGMVSQGHFLSIYATGSPLWNGGTTGPEGSLLNLPLALGILCCMWLYWGKRNSRSPKAEREYSA